RRTPITPADAARLIEQGFSIAVETSSKRIFEDALYRKAGCSIVAAGSWTGADPDALIVGLKELPPEPPALQNRMTHFAHIFKDQHGWREELERFRSGGGTLYDIEYLVRADGRRVAAFGYWAGWMGAALAIWRHMARILGESGPETGLNSFDSRHQVEDEIRRLAERIGKSPRCIVVGAKGRSGSGAIDALAHAGCDVTKWDKEETADLDRGALMAHDLLVNCVLVTGPGLTLVTGDDFARPAARMMTIADVSCDPLSDYNPLPLYDQPTSWARPFIEVGKNSKDVVVELTAIDNLPSLIPLEASEDFSRQFAPVLLTFDHGEEWQAARQVFEDKLRDAR
ncbi:MAG: saccharopine dehydrogenase, partial [Pseudomonadota bacterium]